MADLTGQVGELRMSVQIIRKATGAVENYEVVGAATKEQAEALGAVMADEAEKKED